jgi:DNA recombination protein RmuC
VRGVPAQGAQNQEVLDRLNAIETRAVQELDRLRAASESSAREALAAGANAQKELALQLTGRVDESSKQLLLDLEKRFQVAAHSTSESLAAGRRSQDERLDAVERTLRESLAAFQKSLSELQGGVMKEMAEHGKQQADATSLLRERLLTSVDGFGVRLGESLEKSAQQQKLAHTEARKEQGDALAALRKATEDGTSAQQRAFVELRDSITTSITALGQAQQVAAERLEGKVLESLEKIRTDNTEKLEKIRGTVEEKLQSTLEARLGESFRIVSERLERVHTGLGEMQTLASGVGELKRVLTNVRSRGTFGEVQLGALLEEMLTPAQFERNCATKQGSNDRVEFAIRLPGRDDDGSAVMIPIDAKFPQEDYLRLQDAWEAGDAEKLEAARRGLRARLLSEAATIADKYLDPPHTTDFAILFLPIEGLFAEALRLNGLMEDLRKHRVMLAGPTTLTAILNSLQMGFRTLAIEKRSSEVWKVLGSVKTEFGKFGSALDQVSKKLTEAQNKIEDVGRRKRALDRNLRNVEAAPDDAMPLLFQDTDVAEDEP